MDTDRPVVLVVGATSGIGAATAELLASTHRVAIVGRRRSQLDSVAKLTGAFAIAADITQETQCEQLVTKATERFGRLDGLVLNAGVSRSAAVPEMTLTQWNFVHTTNLTSAFLISKFAIPHLLKTKGSIVAVASLSAMRAGPAFAAYASSKAGMVMLIQSIVRDHGPAGLRANVVCPGWIRTEMSEMEMKAFSADTGTSVEVLFDKAVEHVPARRIGTAAEAAAPIAFLLSKQASYVNGAVLTVDGGSSVVDAGTLMFG